MSLSRDIVRQFQALKEASIPEAVLSSGRLHCLDAIGVGLAASTLVQGGPYRRLAAQDQGGIHLLTGGTSASAADAALINGGLIHALEFDDTHTGSIVHGSSVLAPVALAMAEACGRSPNDALIAYVAGYELLIRIGLAAAGGFQRNGFQVTSLAGTLVAALIAGDMLGASEDEGVHAIGIALSQASGVFEFLTNGSSVKSLHPGWAAHSGIMAAKLAAGGLTGPETSIEGQRGLFNAFARDPSAADRLQTHLLDVGERWHMLDVAFKFLPCCHYLHPFVEVAGEIADQIDGRSDIAEIVLRIAPGAAPIVCEPWAIKVDPPDGHAARWSLPVVTAARFINGKVGHDTFAGKVAPAVLALAKRSRWEPLEPNGFPSVFEAEIACRLVDGRVVAARAADVYGNAGRPPERGDVVEKFRDNAGRCLTSMAVSKLEAFFLTGTARDFSAYAAALKARTDGGFNQ